MSTPIALQLYSLREALAADFAGTLERVAALGYTAVETGQFAGDAARQRELFDALGLQVVAAHVPAPAGEHEAGSLAFMAGLGSENLVVPWLDPELYFQSSEGVLQAAELLNQAAANAEKAGLRLHYHNHDFEFALLDGRPAFDLLEENLDPRILFEIDTYWVETARQDAAQLLRRLGDRAPLLHIKDGPLQRDLPMVAVGEGALPLREIIAAAGGHSQWLIVELDRCDGDMFDAVARSHAYLAQEFSG